MQIRDILISALENVHDLQGHIILHDGVRLDYYDLTMTKAAKNFPGYVFDGSVHLYDIKLTDNSMISSYESSYYVLFFKQGQGYASIVLTTGLCFRTFDNNDREYADKLVKRYDNFILRIRSKVDDTGLLKVHFVIDTFFFSLFVSCHDVKKMLEFDEEMHALRESLENFYPCRTAKQNQMLQKVFGKDSYKLFVLVLSTHGYDFYINSFGVLGAFKDNEHINNRMTEKLKTMVRFLRDTCPLHKILKIFGAKHYKHKHYGVVEINGSPSYVYVKIKTGIMPLMCKYNANCYCSTQNWRYARILEKILSHHERMKEVIKKLNS